jgi:acyl carrier protein
MEKETVQSEIYKALNELFEIELNEITPEKRLYEDFDLDSIDAVDLIVRLQDLTDIKVNPDQFKAIRTVQDIVDVVYDIVHRETQ